jgi:hypothetical protein
MSGIREWLTPILVTIVIFLVGGLVVTTNRIDEKLFKHLTNDDIHCPRSVMVTRAEFDLVSKMREDQIKTMRDMVKDEFTQLRIELRNPQVYKAR